MVLQQKLVDFDDTEIILQPVNVVAAFFSKAKAVEDGATVADKGSESEETAAEDTAKQTRADRAAKQTFGSTDGDTAKQTFRRTATKQTFQRIGLQSEKSVATHLLLENAYGSNLLPDISKVDYLAGNLGYTNLRPLEGLPAFVHDIFVFGYLSREECVLHKGKLHCTSGEMGVAKQVVSSITNALGRAMGKRGYMQTAIVHTVAAGDLQSSTIRATIARIERDTCGWAKRKWKQIHRREEFAAYFVAKCDVSEVPLEEIHSGLYVFEKCLEGYSYEIYSIDNTQDFSGVLDREGLVGYLGFREEEVSKCRNVVIGLWATQML